MTQAHRQRSGRTCADLIPSLQAARQRACQTVWRMAWQVVSQMVSHMTRPPARHANRQNAQTFAQPAGTGVAALCAASLCLALTACASAPVTRTNATSTTAENTNCPDVTRLQAAHLYGSWQIELLQTGQRGILTLRQHPEFADSLRGELHYGGQRSIASGDVEDGEFNLDESRDGKSLFAFWSGQLVPAGCGAEIRGKWQPLPQPGQSAPPAESDFILRRLDASSPA